jgi:wyosine [tRNA(Phe)-imidazoG37] synthetase (radical SAM superfamily)
MSVISLQKGIIYGPVPSRRLGPSLGVNVLPLDFKMCSFDCLYCQYGRTPVPVCACNGRTPLPDPEDVEDALRRALDNLPTKPGYITLSGNGEPTLHPRLLEIVEIMTRLRDDMCPQAETAILSNSVGSWLPRVREALLGLDVRIMKLDSATDEMLQSYNRPGPGVTLAAILEGLRALPEITIQALFTAGPRGNVGEDHLGTWLDIVQSLQPLQVQIYSLDRPTPSRDLLPVPTSELERIAERGRAAGVPITAYGPRSGGELPGGRG